MLTITTNWRKKYKMNHSFKMKNFTGKLIPGVLLGNHSKVYLKPALLFIFSLFTLCLLLLKLLKFLMCLLALTVHFSYSGHRLFEILMGRSGDCLLLPHLNQCFGCKKGIPQSRKKLCRIYCFYLLCFPGTLDFIQKLCTHVSMRDIMQTPA